MRFSFRSELETDAFFVTEDEPTRLTVNGREVALSPGGYFLDKCMKKYPIRVKKGQNRIILTVPFGVYSRLENCFVTGSFGVFGKRRFRIAPLPERVSYSSLTEQGFPFYSGVFTYLTEFDTEAASLSAEYRCRAALLVARIKGNAKPAETPVWGAPYAARLETAPGKGTLETDCYITQENAFGLIHVRDRYRRTDSPRLYNSLHPAHFTALYGLRPTGLAEPPRLTAK